mgnify:CR=1 FL=1
MFVMYFFTAFYLFVLGSVLWELGKGVFYAVAGLFSEHEEVKSRSQIYLTMIAIIVGFICTIATAGFEIAIVCLFAVLALLFVLLFN